MQANDSHKSNLMQLLFSPPSQKMAGVQWILLIITTLTVFCLPTEQRSFDTESISPFRREPGKSFPGLIIMFACFNSNQSAYVLLCLSAHLLTIVLHTTSRF